MATKKPQGIAGIPHIIHLMENRLKALLLADRYAIQHPQGKQPNIALATQLQFELPTTLHLPLQELYAKADAQVKLKGTASKITQAPVISTHQDAP